MSSSRAKGLNSCHAQEGRPRSPQKDMWWHWTKNIIGSFFRSNLQNEELTTIFVCSVCACSTTHNFHPRTSKFWPLFPVPGLFFDATGSYDASFYLSGSLILVSAFLCYPIKRVNAWEMQKSRSTAASNIWVKCAQWSWIRNDHVHWRVLNVLVISSIQILQNGAALCVFWRSHIPWPVSGDFVVLETHELKGS